uniref:Uncharacterized protein n=1 Tax=Setaria italica TaxID=4555 RepID=K3YBL0_SETIT
MLHKSCKSCLLNSSLPTIGVGGTCRSLDFPLINSSTISSVYFPPIHLMFNWNRSSS